MGTDPVPVVTGLHPWHTVFIGAVLSVCVAGAALIMTLGDVHAQRAWLQTPTVDRTGTLGAVVRDCARACSGDHLMSGTVTVQGDGYGPKVQVRVHWRPRQGMLNWVRGGKRVQLSCAQACPWVCRPPGLQAFQDALGVQRFLLVVLAVSALTAAGARFVLRRTACGA